MKKVVILFTVLTGLLMWSCGNSNNNSEESTKKEKLTINQDMIVGEWECIDITNGVTHMKSIAKMQPHIVFTKDSKILSKMKLPDGSSTEQKLDVYKIENGKINSKAFEVNPYIENGKLIIEDPSADNKKIFKKIK